MAQHDETWSTVHLVCYAEPKAAAQLGPVTGPESALTWLYGPDRDSDDDRLDQVVEAAVWGGFGYYDDRAAAEAVFEDPGSVIPALGDAFEAWHALVVPIRHWGEFRFCQRERDFELTPATDDPNPDGPVIVITSTGYAMEEELDMSRLEALLKGLAEVRRSMATTDGVVAQHSIDNPDEDLDAITVSIWRDDQAMQTFAYPPGPHRGQIDRHRDKSMFDRSSFTRLRAVRSAGLWNGVNPVG